VTQIRPGHPAAGERWGHRFPGGSRIGSFAGSENGVIARFRPPRGSAGSANRRYRAVDPNRLGFQRSRESCIAGSTWEAARSVTTGLPLPCSTTGRGADLT
jgi:hypothetical protein